MGWKYDRVGPDPGRSQVQKLKCPEIIFSFSLSGHYAYWVVSVHFSTHNPTWISTRVPFTGAVHGSNLWHEQFWGRAANKRSRLC